MTASLRCLGVGLSVFALAGVLSPSIAAAAPTPAPASSTSTSSAQATPGQSPSSRVTYQRDPGAFSLGVSPARLAFGQKDIGSTQPITVINRGQAPLAVTVQKRSFTVGSDGSVRYEKDAPHSGSSWVSVSPEQLQIEPGAAQVVTATVRAPKTYEPGDHQVALVFVVPAAESGGNIKVRRGVGLPIYITAPGEVVDSVSLSGLAAPGFATGGPVAITATVTNAGTVHHDFRAPSPLTVAGAGTAEPFPDFTVPRSSTRDIATTWEPPFLCVCHLTVTMTSADGGPQSQSVRVVVFPWPWFAAAIGAVLLVLLLVRTGRRHYRAKVHQAAAALSARVSAGDV